MVPVAPPRVWHGQGPSPQRAGFLLSGSQHPGEGQISEDLEPDRTGAGKRGQKTGSREPELQQVRERVPRASAQVTAAGPGTQHRGHRPQGQAGFPHPPSPVRSPATLTPARPLGAASARRGRARGPHSQRQATTASAGRAQEIPPLPGLRGAGGGGHRWQGQLDPSWGRRSPGCAAPGAPPTADHPPSLVGQAGLDWRERARTVVSKGRLPSR